MLHAIFHWRLIRPRFVASKLVKRAPAGIHAERDVVILGRRFHVCRLLRLDELALEKGNFLGVIELDDVARLVDAARDYAADNEHMGVPLDHDVRIDGQPDRAVAGHRVAVIAAHRVVPALIGLGPRLGETVVDADGLQRVAIAELPNQVVAGDELAQPRVERLDVVVLEIDLDECFPVVVALLDFDAIEHIARKIEVRCGAHVGQVRPDVANAVEEQPVPALQRWALQLDARLLFEMWSAQQLAVELIGPTVDRADNVRCRAAAGEHDGLPVATDIRQKLHATVIADQYLRVIAPGKGVIVAHVGDHQFVADVTGPAIEQDLAFDLEQRGVVVPGDGQLRRGLPQPLACCEIGHQPFLPVNRQPNKQYKRRMNRPPTALLSQPATKSFVSRLRRHMS